MAFERPNLSELRRRFRADLRTYTAGSVALLRSRSFESLLSRIVPNLTHGLYGHLAWVVRQLHADRCDGPMVLRWATLLGIALKPGAPAISSLVEFATTGPSIPLGALVQRGDGVRYRVTAAGVDGGVCKVEIEAEEPGAAGNADPSSPITLTLVSPVAGVDSEGTVTDPLGIHDGVDVESVEQLRARVLQRLSTPPRGGGRGDYVAWALEVPGVTRAWETPRVLGGGTVGLQFVTDDPNDPSASPIPSPEKVDEVHAYVEARAPSTLGRSATSAVVAQGAALGVSLTPGAWVGLVTTAPTAHEINPEIAIAPDTPAVRDAVEAALHAFLAREAAPGQVVRLSRLREAISLAAGEFDHELVSPTVDVTPAADALPILGAISWA